MAIRLPDAASLGPADLRVERPRARFDNSVVSDGMAAQGRAIQQAGTEAGRTVEQVGGFAGRAVEKAGSEWATAIEGAGRAQAKGMHDLGEGITKVGAAVADYKTELDKMDYARAKADFRVKKAEIDTIFDRDTDYLTLPKRYREEIGKAQEQSTALIGNDRFRVHFKADTDVQIADGGRSADRHAFKLERGSRLAELDGRLTDLSNSALSARRDVGGTISDARDLVDSYAGANYLDPGDATRLKREWGEKYAEQWAKGQTPEQRVNLLSRGPRSEDEFLDRLTGAESGGKAGARNPNSTAAGPTQFIEQTWLGTLKKYGPAEIAGKIEADPNGRHFVADKAIEKQILGLRDDPKLSREMTRALSRENAQALSTAGLGTTADNLYLAHFLGVERAVAVLKADPGTPVSELLPPKVIAANAQVLSGKTAGTVTQWAGQKMGLSGPSGTVVDFLPEPRRAQLLQQAQQEVQQISVVNSAARNEQFNRSIIDASAGLSPLLPRAQIENDPMLTGPSRNTLLKAWDSAAGDIVKYQRAVTRFNDPAGGSFNPFDKDDKDSVDKIYQGLGGNLPALQRVVERTGIVPATVGTSMRADVASNDVGRVAQAATLARNILTKNPTALTAVPGGNDIEDAATKFGHYVDSFGMSADEAAKKIVQQSTPEYKAAVKARIKSEDVNEMLKKKLSIGDVEGVFDRISYVPFTDPKVAFSPEARGKMFGDFAELTKEKYLEHGDFDLAKKQAGDQLKKVWGPTYVNGSTFGVVMPYPPERSPRMAGVENASELIAAHAIESIKGETGQDVERKNIRLDVIPGVTPSAYKSGQAVPYALTWTDKNGVVQMLNPGRAFVVDATQISEMQSKKRQAEFEALRNVPDPFGGRSNMPNDF